MTPQDALEHLVERIHPLATQTLPLCSAVGRVLCQSVLADRDSPAADVSAMDGYAITQADLQCSEPLIVGGQSAPGHSPASPKPQTVMRVFTGAVVPADYDLVVRREDTIESGDQITLGPQVASEYRVGQNIRRQGENGRIGSEVLSPGRVLHPGAIAAAASFGAAELTVSRRLRVAILVTGDELAPVEAQVAAWQLRDSNGPMLEAMFADRSWLQVVARQRVVDSKTQLYEQLGACLEKADAVIMTGGVSMGDYDFVPDAVAHCGGQTVFHKLPIRPGKPILGAVSKAGQPIFGLPGNPLSAALGCLRFVLPTLARQASVSDWLPHCPRVRIINPDQNTLPLHWFRLVKIQPDATASLVPSQGSGDLVALAASDGFIEQSPDSHGPGPWAFWGWH